jgi:hypothetical protein
MTYAALRVEALARAVLKGVFIVAAVALALAGGIGSTHAQGCQHRYAGLDSSKWITSDGPIFGQAMGQTFYAADTIIPAVTVWRPPGNPSYIGAKLYITATTGYRGQYLAPNVRNILQEGPTLRIHDSDPPGQMIPMRFPIDPPLVLPSRGEYAIMFQAEGCWSGQAWLLIADTRNDYADGMYWVTGRAGGCYLPAIAGGGDYDDLCFRIEYCAEATTPARRNTWGQLKILYR